MASCCRAIRTVCKTLPAYRCPFLYSIRTESTVAAANQIDQTKCFNVPHETTSESPTVESFIQKCPFAKVVLSQNFETPIQVSAIQPKAKINHQYDAVFDQVLNKIKNEGRYREFIKIERKTGKFPEALHHNKQEQSLPVTVWCSNDYLGMGQHPKVLDAMHEALRNSGAGSGGTRNISGNTHYHVLLERELAQLHNQQASLLFSSCYIANSSTISTFGKILPNAILFSDEQNHASLIEGIRYSGLKKHIFRHNDLDHLEQLLRDADPNAPKMIIFESVYSMDGSIAPISKVCDLAEKYNALTFIDEVHAVGLYGEHGAGVAERDNVAHRLDIVSGTLGKAFGVYGGYIAASEKFIDMIRSTASGFIFTTSLPPVVTAGALASVSHLRKSTSEREEHARRYKLMKEKLKQAGLPVMETDSHIIPVLIGNAQLCKAASDILLKENNIYIQPINYPTVPVGTERFRLTPGPFHSDKLMDQLISCLVSTFKRLNIPMAS